MLLKSVGFIWLTSAIAVQAAFNKITLDTQSITDGIMTDKEYAAYIEFLETLRNNRWAAQAYCDTYTGHSFFNMFKISARCSSPLVLYPPDGRDGSYYACNMDKLRKPCVIYSIGSENNFIFEEAIEKFGCEIHTFDCHASGHGAPASVQYHKWCIDGHNWRGDHFTIGTLMSKLDHKKIDFLKIDIEGTEYPSLPRLADLPPESLPEQIAVEIHPWPELPGHKRTVWKLHATLDLILSLHRLGYRLLSRDDYTPAPCCSQFLFGLPHRLPGGPAPFPHGFASQEPSSNPLTPKTMPRDLGHSKDNHIFDRHQSGKQWAPVFTNPFA